jgi:hypothetical protein
LVLHGSEVSFGVDENGLHAVGTGRQDLPEQYEDRLVAYIDILGWKEACDTLEPTQLVQALDLIHEHPRQFNEAERLKLLEFGQKPGVTWINPMRLQVRAAAFSDNVVVSEPAAYGCRIFTIRRMCVRLLELGFLSRGGVSLGHVYHEDNVVFGPALNRAVEIEQGASFPRIVCDTPVVELLKEDRDFAHEVIRDGVDGKYVVNLFPPVFRKSPAYIWKQVLDSHYRFDDLLRVISAKTEQLRAPTEKRKLEKWVYMENYVKARREELVEFGVAIVRQNESS